MRYGVAARWVTEDRSKRVVPQPRTLMQLARLLDIPPIEMLRHAGYAPGVTESSDPDEQQIQSLQRRLRRIIRAVPEPQRQKALALAISVLDWLQILTDRFLD